MILSSTTTLQGAEGWSLLVLVLSQLEKLLTNLMMFLIRSRKAFLAETQKFFP